MVLPRPISSARMTELCYRPRVHHPIEALHLILSKPPGVATDKVWLRFLFVKFGPILEHLTRYAGRVPTLLPLFVSSDLFLVAILDQSSILPGCFCIWKIFPLDIIIGELFLLPPTLHIHDTLDGGVAVLKLLLHLELALHVFNIFRTGHQLPVSKLVHFLNEV